jgi:uncharacterized membrane protein
MSPVAKRYLNSVESLSMRITRMIGTPASVLIHSLLFLSIFTLYFWGVTFDQILLVLTTAVSLEAIYLSIFIQMSINRTTESIEEVHEDVGEIAKEVDEIQEDVEDIGGDVDEISKDIDELQEDVEDISEDVDDLSKDIEEIQEEEESDEEKSKLLISSMEAQLKNIMQELQALKKQNLHP